MYNVSPIGGEQYFLHILLSICKGCKSFEDLRTFDGYQYSNFKSACIARGLLESDEEWIACIQEATFVQTSFKLR